MKKCSCCQIKKPLEAFHADKGRHDGKYPYCRECTSYRKKNKVYKITERRWARTRIEICKDRINYWTNELNILNKGAINETDTTRSV